MYKTVNSKDISTQNDLAVISSVKIMYENVSHFYTF